MTNGPMFFPLGVEGGAAGALTDGDADFPLVCLQCLFPSQFGIILFKTVWSQIEVRVFL